MEQLLQMKRLEQPEVEFWTRFERDLKQRQLQALVKPRMTERVKGWLTGRQPVFGAAVGAAAVCALAVWLAFPSLFQSGQMTESMTSLEERSAAMGNEPMAFAHVDLLTGGEPFPTEAGPSAATASESRFMIETLAGKRAEAELHFRTESQPQTLFAAAESGRDYRVRSYTREGVSGAGSGSRTLQF